MMNNAYGIISESILLESTSKDIVEALKNLQLSEEISPAVRKIINTKATVLSQLKKENVAKTIIDLIPKIQRMVPISRKEASIAKAIAALSVLKSSIGSTNSQTEMLDIGTELDKKKLRRTTDALLLSKHLMDMAIPIIEVSDVSSLSLNLAAFIVLVLIKR